MGGALTDDGDDDVEHEHDARHGDVLLLLRLRRRVVARRMRRVVRPHRKFCPLQRKSGR